MKKWPLAPFGEARQTALEAGERTYQGARCPHGHSGIRITRCNQCVECEARHRANRRSHRAKPLVRVRTRKPPLPPVVPWITRDRLMAGR